MTPVTNLTKSDESIKADVVDELRWDASVDASKVQVRVDDGIVTLTGTVPSMNSRSAASADAWTVRGVMRVDNDLKIELPPSPPVPSDETLQSNVLSTLEWDPDIDASNIEVLTEGGSVTLAGTVPSHWEKTRAEQLASGLRGVIALINEIAVVPTEKFADEAIAEDITAVLERSVLVDAGQVDVTVIDGEVTLMGSVPTAAARDAAYRAAARTAGVINVRNDLVISP